MSEENVALVRELLEMFRRRDHERAFDFYDPEIEWDATRVEGQIQVPGLAGVYRGHDGVRRYWRRWLEAWDDIEFEVEDVLDAGDDVVALISNQRQWGRSSGIATEIPPYALVFTIEHAKVRRWCIYSNRKEALKAAGISA